MPDYRALSLWHDTAADDWVPRDPLRGDLRADVAVVGAGLTGLWTAYYLLRANPSLRVVVLEAETAGFGSSGRFGCCDPGPHPARHGQLTTGSGDPDVAWSMHAALWAAVDEVGRVTVAEGIEAQFRKAGRIALVRSRAQVRAAAADVEQAEALGRGDVRLLSAAEARERLGASHLLGAVYTPGCAVLHPVRLARGLAQVVDSAAGGQVYERTVVTSIKPHRVRTAHGTVSADVVVRATGGYTPALHRHRRLVVPVHAHAIATGPLTAALWQEIGLADGETFTDYRHRAVHGLRTADDRLVLSGPGASYRFGSKVRPDPDPRAFVALWATLRALFPMLAGAPVTHAWGGVLGVTRDGTASVGLDPATGLAWAEGHGRNAVGTSNLAGRTLRDLVLGRDTSLTRLPWVDHHPPVWPHEPARWLVVNAGQRLAALADREERLLRRPSRLARAPHHIDGR